MISFLKSLLGFTKSEGTKAQSTPSLTQGYIALEQGNALFIANGFAHALEKYDLAVKCQINDAYQHRAMCLQKLEYHIDALQDFDKAITNSPEDCNLYFMRAWSRIAIGLNKEAISDIHFAVKFGKVDNERNRIYYEGFVKSNPDTFHENISDFYQSHLSGIESMASINELMHSMNQPKNTTRRPTS